MTAKKRAARTDLWLFEPHELTLVVGKPHSSIIELEKAGHLRLIRDPSHELYDRRADLPVDESLGWSMVHEGQLSNLQVQKDGDEHVIVVGRQRLKAAAFLAAQGTQFRLKAERYRGDKSKNLRAIIVENEHRTADDPVTRAMKIQQAREFGMGQDEIQRLFRMTQASIEQHLRLLDCADEVQEAVRSGKIRMTLASDELSRMKREKQREAIDKLIASGVTRGAKAKAAVREIKKGKKDVDPSKVKARKNAPPRDRMEAWVAKLEDHDDPVLRGVRMGLQRAMGLTPKGWENIQLVLDQEDR